MLSLRRCNSAMCRRGRISIAVAARGRRPLLLFLGVIRCASAMFGRAIAERLIRRGDLGGTAGGLSSSWTSETSSLERNEVSFRSDGRTRSAADWLLAASRTSSILTGAFLISRSVRENSISGSEMGSWIDLSKGVWLADDPGALFDLP